MLGHISVLLEQARPPLAIDLATDAMAALCQCDVRYFYTHLHISCSNENAVDCQYSESTRPAKNY